ncbi:MAG: GntR family transcriptional regulator [Parvibaculaceae bacterium]
MIEDSSVADRLKAVFRQQAHVNESKGGPTLYARVYQTIREALLLGILAPGETLSIRIVAAALGISSMPVREALGRLMIDGALDSLPNRAFRIPLTSAQQYHELLLMRLRLETLAGEHAAIRIQPRQLTHLRHCFDMLTANENSNASLTDYLTSHRRFHFEIYKIAQMPRVYNAIETLWLRVGPLFNEASSTFSYRDKVIYHADIYRAMETCNPKAASVAIENDIMSMGQRTLQFLDEKGRATDPAPIESQRKRVADVD